MVLGGLIFLIWAAGAYYSFRRWRRLVLNSYGPGAIQDQRTKNRILKRSILWFLPFPLTMPVQTSWLLRKNRERQKAQQYLQDQSQQIRDANGQ